MGETMKFQDFKWFGEWIITLHDQELKKIIEYATAELLRREVRKD